MEQKRVLTPKEVAEELHCDIGLVYRQLRNGTIPNVRLGDKFLIPRAAFDKWLEGNTAKVD